MAIPRRFTIAESSHRILDPFTPAKIADLGNALHLRPGMRLLDLACGKGEALNQWAAAHGITGTGVDINPPFLRAAVSRAEQLGVADKVEFVEDDASDYVSDQTVDIASCCGATWIGGGILGTLHLLEKSLAPGGVAVIGDCYWRETPPDQEAIAGSMARSVDDFPTLWGLIGSLQEAGWDVVEMVHADEHSWDRYVAAQWFNLREFIDANPDDEIVPELRAELDTEPVRYARYQRRYLGWGAFALKRK